MIATTLVQTDEASHAEGQHSDLPRGLRLVLSAAGAITSQALVVTAMLYYFGQVYTRTWFAHFGIDVGMLGYSIPDYVVRSVNGAYWPALLALLAAVALAGLRPIPILVAARTRRPRQTLRRWFVSVVTLGASLLAAVAAGIVLRAFLPAAMSRYLPLMLISGAALLGYAIALRMWYPVQLGPRRHRRRDRSTDLPWVTLLALLAIGVLGTMWSVGGYAADQADQDARTAELTHFADRPLVLLFSVDRLAIEGGASRVDPITVPDEKFRYVYSGLTLLSRTPDRYFLIPYDWKAKRDRVFIIGTSDNIRIDIARHP
ncbi:hypothetical protein OHA40_04225 [Nocardia sp. NBC_00508]|uniref:hypothetical protein n=1 Tax=Nocardia sp. NBC_00508 TaxID=2975992 RepID=UPI002E8038F4|nr:hypothetical protein [Nocardia sp. NBC_00508]WUD67367.1 hypothetical protein OHA40_04225 [Nocardia sp. NBC_00508]